MAERSRSSGRRMLLVHRSGVPRRRRRRNRSKAATPAATSPIRPTSRSAAATPAMPRRSGSPSIPTQLSYDDLLDIFFATHDPTQLNRQGNDVGTQYRSAIFPHERGAGSARRARRSRAPTREQGGRVVTTIEPTGEWYPAEDYHQDYWAGEGQRNPYCLATHPAQAAEAAEELPGAGQEREPRPPRLRRGAAGR